METEKRQILSEKQKYIEHLSSGQVYRMNTNFPSEHKFASSLGAFKRKRKGWICETCLCKLHQAYHPNTGYIWNKILIPAIINCTVDEILLKEFVLFNHVLQSLSFNCSLFTDDIY